MTNHYPTDIGHIQTNNIDLIPYFSAEHHILSLNFPWMLANVDVTKHTCTTSQ